MDRWSQWTQFFACGLLVLPIVLGVGLASFEAFSIALAVMLLLLIGVTLGAPTVPAPSDHDDAPPHDDNDPR